MPRKAVAVLGTYAAMTWRTGRSPPYCEMKVLEQVHSKIPLIQGAWVCLRRASFNAAEPNHKMAKAAS